MRASSSFSIPKPVIAGLVPATHDNRLAVARLAAPRLEASLRGKTMHLLERGAASGAIDTWVVMGGRDKPGHDDVVGDNGNGLLTVTMAIA